MEIKFNQKETGKSYENLSTCIHVLKYFENLIQVSNYSCLECGINVHGMVRILNIKGLGTEVIRVEFVGFFGLHRKCRRADTV